MKKSKRSQGLITLFVLVLIIIICSIAMIVTSNETKELKGEVQGNYKDGDVYIATEDGNGWNLSNPEFEMIDKSVLTVGTKVLIKFDTLGTSNIYDDVIIDIKLIDKGGN
jgi:hypothetical protein